MAGDLRHLVSELSLLKAKTQRVERAQLSFFQQEPGRLSSGETVHQVVLDGGGCQPRHLRHPLQDGVLRLQLKTHDCNICIATD